MNRSIKNIFGVAAAVIVLLGFNFMTGNNTLVLPDHDTKTEHAENKEVTSLADLNNAIVDIAEKANPSVVTVTTEVIEEQRVLNPFSQFFDLPDNRGRTQERVRRGLGSGVIVSEEGYIITNNHVIDNATEIKVRLYEGDEMDAELIGADPQTDIAVLKIDVENAPAMGLGNSDELKVGSFVLAIGSPLQEQLAHTVSFGIVSAKGRNIGLIQDREWGLGYEDFIQTDAAINPGNSGGALVDMNGNLIGINSAIASRSGGNDGIGFSIPSNMVKRIMTDLIDDGMVSRGYLGIRMAGEVDQTMARALGLDNTRGIIIGSVEDDGPAKAAGLKEEDIIVSVNGEKVKSWNSFRAMIAAFQPGSEVEFGVIRDGEEEKFDVTIGERPKGEIVSNRTDNSSKDIEEQIGFSVTTLTSDIAKQLQVENDIEGVVVDKIRKTSNAYERGLRKGSIITKVKQEKVDDTADFYEKTKEAIDNGDEVILLTVKVADDLEQYIAFEL